MTTEDATIECTICKTVIEDVYIFPDVIARFYKWTMAISNRYCPKHSIKEIICFEEKLSK